MPAVGVVLTCPLGSVLTEGVAKVALALVAGEANVTVTPGTTLLWASLTTATSAEVNVVFTVGLWLVPDTTAMVAAAPGALVAVKEAGVPTPAAAALMLYAPERVLAVGANDALPFGSVATGFV